MTEQVFWMVVTENGIHYTRRLVKDGLTEEAANELKAGFPNNKTGAEHQHKVEYYVFPYTRSTRQEVMKRERVDE